LNESVQLEDVSGRSCGVQKEPVFPLRYSRPFKRVYIGTQECVEAARKRLLCYGKNDAKRTIQLENAFMIDVDDKKSRGRRRDG